MLLAWAVDSLHFAGVRNGDIRVTVESRVPRRATLIKCQNLGRLRRLAEGALERCRGTSRSRRSAGKGRAVWNGAEICRLNALPHVNLMSWKF
jgi:hypothetical protein